MSCGPRIAPVSAYSTLSAAKGQYGSTMIPCLDHDHDVVAQGPTVLSISI